MMQISNGGQVQQLLAAQMSAEQTSQKIQYSIARKQLDVQQQAGDAAIQLLEQAVNVSKTANSAGKVDVYA